MKALSQRRRHPLAAVALLLMGLVVTGGLYAAAGSVNEAKASTVYTASDIEEGNKLFVANCATCHGLNAEGTPDGPSLVGVGAAAVDFQVGTGRMPMQMQGPQAQVKPVQFDDEQTASSPHSLPPSVPVPQCRTRNGSTRPWATRPTVERSSAPTAPCATTPPPQAAR